MKKLLLYIALSVATLAQAQQLMPTEQQKTDAPTLLKSHELRTAVVPAAATLPLRASADYTTEEVNEYGIIMSPAAGEERTYTRVGGAIAYNYMESKCVTLEQEGGLVLVECNDGTVYMKQPISNYGLNYAADSWIKGKREGHKLVFPGNQKVNHVTMYGMDDGVRVCHGNYSASSYYEYVPDREAPIVFTESDDGYQLFLDGTDEKHIIGVFWDDGDFALMGNFETELVADGSAFEETVVTPPENLETEYYILEGKNYKDGQPYLLDVEIGFDGNDAYLTGFSTTFPESWIKGTRDGNRIVFPMAQYIGTDAGTNLYVYGGYIQNGGVAISDFYLTYNPQKDAYVGSTGLLITRGKVASTVIIAEHLSNITMYRPGQGEIPVVDIRYDIPEGDMKTYARFGGNYYTFFGYILDGRQEGKHIDIVTAPNGKTIYMMNPISQGATEPGSWIEGTIGTDGKIHMPLGQYTYQDPDSGLAMQTALLRLTVTGDAASPILDFVYDDSYDEVTFTIHPDGSLTLDPVTDEVIYEGYPSTCYGLIYNDDLTWTGYGDYDTRYVPFDAAYVTIPSNVAHQKWAYHYSDGTNDLAAEVLVGIDGDKFYMAGLNANTPEAAIVGNIADGKVTFASDQYIGNSAYDIFLYMVGANYTTVDAYDEEFDFHYSYQQYEYLPNLVFDYDAADRRLTSSGNVALLVNQGVGATNVFTPTVVGLQPYFLGFDEMAATPADPSVIDYGFYYDEYGYDVAEFFIPTKDVDDNYIATDKLYYIVWTRRGDVSEPLVLTPDVYEGLDNELTEVPYSLTVTNTSGWSSVIAGGKRVMLFETGYDDLGIQSIYYGAGERRTSSIVWWGGTTEDGIAAIAAPSASFAIYSLDGRRVASPAKGLYITTDGKKFVK